MKPVDCEGAVFQVGDLFLSAQGRSGNMKLNKYRVLSIEDKGPDWRGNPRFSIKAMPYRKYDWESSSPIRIVKFDSCYILPSAV